MCNLCLLSSSSTYNFLQLFILLIYLFGFLFNIGQCITSFPEHGGAYSLFPHEDLRTGKTLRTFDTSSGITNRRINDNNNNYNSQQISSRYRGESRLPYDSRERENYRSLSSLSSPLENYQRYNNRILFDDERLNYRGPTRPYLPARIIESFRRYPSIVPAAFPEAKLPVRAKIPDESLTSQAFLSDLPTRIHVFNPDSKTFVHSHDVQPRVLIDKPNIPSNEDVKPGRILIPGKTNNNAIVHTNEPGPDLFLNHEEYLEYHTKIALQELQRSTTSHDSSKNANRVVLFSPSSINRGLVPPPPSNSDEINSSNAGSGSIDSQSQENESDTFFRTKSQKEKKVHVTSLLDNPEPQRPDQEISLETISSSSSKPLLESGFVPSRHYFFETGEAKSPRTKATQGISSTTTTTVKVDSSTKSTEVPRRILTIYNNSSSSTSSPVTKSSSYPYVKKSSPITRISKLNSNSNPPITFSPSPIDEQTEIPLIFVESKEKVSGDFKGKVVVVKRLRKKSKDSSIDSTSPSSVGNRVKASSITSSTIETTMTVVKNQSLPSIDELKADFNLSQINSTSNSGVVARVHAHTSKCPQLHSQAEILCDVHIRKRHGKSNPQLTVGWKRKFYNETSSDLILSLNTSPAYFVENEEDFHDRFNVTLAPGISPMLRSVLTIKNVGPMDTGNYQCEVDDGENQLKSETLLFLCH